MNARLEALKLAVATQGNPNKVALANEYLAFLEPVTPVVTVAGKQPKSK